MFEPQKFFIGVIDFFAIILPGAILTFLVKDKLGPFLLSSNYYKLTGAAGWAAFLGGSYLLGHFVFLIGAGLLDDLAYDPLRKASYGAQIGRLAKDMRLSALPFRFLARIFMGKESDRTVNLAVRIKDHYIRSLGDTEAINAFQWSKAKLMFSQSAAIESVHRHEADSKFFRSLVIVCIIVMILARFELVDMRRQLVYTSITVLILAFWRYVDQRMKATTQAYWYVLTLEGTADRALRKQSGEIGGPTHAGGVVFRGKPGKLEYLLVRAQAEAEEWVLPKGHIERGEDMKRTAVREVHEEAGVWARVKEKLAIAPISVKGKTIRVQFYVMQSADGPINAAVSHLSFLLSKAIWWLDRKDRDRRARKWLSLDEAIKLAKYPKSRDLLQLADEKLSSLFNP